jgi:hypothetical protein
MQRTRQDAVNGLLPDERERLTLERLRTQGRVPASELAVESHLPATRLTELEKVCGTVMVATS